MTSLVDRLEAFLAGAAGGSVRTTSLHGLSPEAAHHRLLATGFDHERRPLAAERTVSGAPKARRLDGGATSRLDDPFLAVVDLYLHPDGGMVEVLPAGDPSGRQAPRGAPSAIKTVRFDASLPAAFANEAFRVTDDGHPVPKSRRAAFGTKQDRLDPAASLRFANAVARRGVIWLVGAASCGRASGEPHPIGQGLTVVPPDFWAAAEALRAHAALDPTVRIVEEGPDTALHFGSPSPGAEEEKEPAATPEPGLATLRILRGGCVFQVDPEGYEASVAHLGLAFRWVLDRLGPCRVIDDETGADRSFEAMRLPSSVLDGGLAPEFEPESEEAIPDTEREVARAS